MTRLASERILDLQQPLTWCDHAIEWVLAATLLFAPAAFGTTEAWSQQIFFAAIAVLAGLMTVNLLSNRQSSLVWTWAYVPMVLYLAMVALSIIPLPAGVLNAISPGTVAAKRELLADLPNVDQLTQHSTISFEAWSTERGLRIVASLAVLFIVAVNTFRTPQQIKRLLVLITVAGTAVTLLTLAQDITSDRSHPPAIYWTFSWYNGPTPNSGPFYGHAQLGQYLNLVTGAMLALAIVLVAETFAGEDVNLSDVVQRLGETKIRLAGLLLILAALSACAMALAASAGAMIGFGVAAVVATGLVLIKRGWRTGETPAVVFTGVAVAAVLGGLVGLVFVPKLMQRHTSVLITGANRKAILKHVPDMVAKWPVMGSGLESFEWTYPSFQDPTEVSPKIADHAENDYAQTLTDTGIVGGVLTAAFLAVLFGNWIRAYRGRRPIHLASIGVAFSFIAVMVHSCADFAQRTPAVAMVSALLAAVVVSLARVSAHRVPAGAAPEFGFAPLPRLVLGLAVVAVMGWALWSVNAVRMGERFYYESDPVYTADIRPYDADAAERLARFFDIRIDGCQTALQYDPKSPLYIQYLNEFRWRKLSRQLDPKTRDVVYPADAKVQSEQIVKELSAARALCPTFGPPYILQGKIQWALLDREQGRKLLQRGYELKPVDPEINFTMAEVAAADGRWDDAIRWVRLCFAGDRRYVDRIADLFVTRYPQAERGIEAFKYDGTGLMAIDIRLPPDAVELRRKINEVSIEAERAHLANEPDDAPAHASLARQLEVAGRKSEAVDELAKALLIDYGRTDWRLYRARLLNELDRVPEAIGEAESVLHANGHSEEAKALLDQLQDPKRRRKAP